VTTTKRSAITVEQQFRWHRTFEAALNEMRRRNQGLCHLTNLTFGEVIQHFITGGDETCFMASKDGSIQVIGSVGNRKTEKRTSDS